MPVKELFILVRTWGPEQDVATEVADETVQKVSLRQRKQKGFWAGLVPWLVCR